MIDSGKEAFEMARRAFLKSFWKSRNLFSKRFLAAGGIYKSVFKLGWCHAG